MPKYEKKQVEDELAYVHMRWAEDRVALKLAQKEAEDMTDRNLLLVERYVLPFKNNLDQVMRSLAELKSRFEC